jgi:hypothetical protein
MLDRLDAGVLGDDLGLRGGEADECSSHSSCDKHSHVFLLDFGFTFFSAAKLGVH